MGIIYQMHDLHVTGVSTRWWYYLHNYMLCHWYNNIPNCDCGHGISYYSIHSSWLFFQISIISDEYGSSRANCSLCFSACMRFKVRWRICCSLTVWSQLWYESSTGTRIFNWELGLGPTYIGSVDCWISI